MRPPRFLVPVLASFALLGNSAAGDPAKDAPVPVKVRSKIVISPAEPAIEGPVLDAEAYQAFLRREARRAGVDLASLPSVVMKQDQPATIQVVRTQGAGAVWDGEQPAQPFAGWILHLAPTPAGKQLKLEARADYGFVPGTHPAANMAPAEDPDWELLVTRTGRGGATLSPGEALVIPLGEVEPGIHVTCFAHVHPIDPSGRPEPDFSRRIPVPVSSPGVLRAQATLIEQTADNELLSIFASAGPGLSLVAILSTDQITFLEEKKAAKLQKLDPVEFPTGKPLRPWKEIKDLKITGSLPESRTVIDLTCSLESSSGTSQTGITLYPGSAAVYSLPSDKPDVRRLVAIRLDIVE